MNHFGEIAYLSAIAKPDVAVIVNIGTMHIEHLGSMKGILQAKLEILEGMDSRGKIVLNGDDPLLWNLHKTLQDAVYFGQKNTRCAVMGMHVEEVDATLRFSASYNDKQYSVLLPLEGRHYVSDALAAISVGMLMGVEETKIQKSLGEFHNMEGRQEIFQAGEYTIIKDCYNAGPESMEAALSVLGNRKGRKIAVLGDMLELGVCAQAEHYRVGRIAAEKVDLLFAYGPNSSRVVSGALTGGMMDTKVSAFEDRQKLVSALKKQVRPGDTLLFKGSHGMQMDLTLEMFLNKSESSEERP